MDALPSIIPKSIVEVLNRLENDEDNLFSWKLTQSQDSFSLTVSYKLRAKTPNKAKDNNSEVNGRTTSAKPVRRRRRKKNQSPSALACSRKRHAHFLEKKLAGKPVLTLPEEESITTVPGVPDAVESLCVTELENTSPVGGSNRDLVSLEDPTSSPDSDPDLSINERAFLRKFLDTVNTDSEDSDDDLRVRCTINRSHSTPCKKAEFEHLQIFPGHCLDFFLSVSGKICHSPIKKVKRQPTLIISFSQHSPFFGEQSKNLG